MIEIQRFFNEIGKNENSEEDFYTLSHFLCKTYGWDYYTLLKQPIPFIIYLVNANKIESEKQKNQMKKAQRKRRGL
jgi:hypothetical protein